MAVEDLGQWHDREAREGYIRARLRPLRADEGGRSTPLGNGYRACWDIGATYEGRPTLNDAPILFEHGDWLALGDEGIVRLHPLAWEFWENVTAGQVIHAYEGSKRVGVATVLERIGPTAVR